jgi:hypothetical protein
MAVYQYTWSDISLSSSNGKSGGTWLFRLVPQSHRLLLIASNTSTSTTPSICHNRPSLLKISLWMWRWGEFTSIKCGFRPAVSVSTLHALAGNDVLISGLRHRSCILACLSLSRLCRLYCRYHGAVPDLEAYCYLIHESTLPPSSPSRVCTHCNHHPLSKFKPLNSGLSSQSTHRLPCNPPQPCRPS